MIGMWVEDGMPTGRKRYRVADVAEGGWLGRLFGRRRRVLVLQLEEHRLLDLGDNMPDLVETTAWRDAGPGDVLPVWSPPAAGAPLPANGEAAP